MNSNRKQTIFFSLVLLLILLVTIVGATFAWFSISVQNEKSSTNVVNNVIGLLQVEYDSSPKINIKDITFEKNKITKTFTIKNNSVDTLNAINYKIYLNVSENTLLEEEKGLYLLSLNSSTSLNGVLAKNIKNNVLPGVGKKLLGSGKIYPDEKQNYEVTITLDKSLNAISDKTFLSELSVEAVVQR